MYRAQDIGSRDELVGTCAAVLSTGQLDLLYQVLPHITLTRDKSFCPILVNLLERGDRDQQIFAAIALGSLACERSVPPLRRALLLQETYQGTGTQSLQRALIFALGESGQSAAVQPLLDLFGRQSNGDPFSSRRRELIITALGTLAQYDVDAAAETLYGFLSSREGNLRARAVTELGVAAWHRKEVPAAWESAIRECLLDSDEEVQFAAWAAMENFANLGSPDSASLLEEVLEAIPA